MCTHESRKRARAHFIASAGIYDLFAGIFATPYTHSHKNTHTYTHSHKKTLIHIHTHTPIKTHTYTDTHTYTNTHSLQ